MIKSHPGYTPFTDLFKKGGVRHCSKCIPDPFIAAVVITRHPLHAFFAEYNRGMDHLKHTGRIKKKKFLPKHFLQTAVKNAYAVRHWYENDFSEVAALGDRAIFVQFEQLVSSDVAEKRAALRKILKFVTADGTHFSDGIETELCLFAEFT